MKSDLDLISDLTAEHVLQYVKNHPNEEIIIKHNKYNEYVVELEDGLYNISKDEAFKYIAIIKIQLKKLKIEYLNKPI